MKDFGIGSLINSATRLAQGCTELLKKRDPLMLKFLKRESSILVTRAIKVWWNLRFGRMPWEQKENSSSSGDSEK